MTFTPTLRSFWMEVDCDRYSDPESQDHGFELAIFVRVGGVVRRALDVTGRTAEDGELSLNVTEHYSGLDQTLTVYKAKTVA